MSERNHEVIKSQQLLDEYGNIAEPGWSRKQLQQYSRTQIKAPKFWIKEWDYYLVVGDDCAVAFTLSDDGYVGLQSVSLLDFSGEPWEHTETILDAFPIPVEVCLLPYKKAIGQKRYIEYRRRLSKLLEEHPRLMEKLDLSYFNDRVLAKVVLKYRWPLGLLPQYQDDEVMVRYSLSHSGEAIEFASKRFQNNREWVKFAIEHSANGTIMYLDCMKPYRKDKELVYLACKVERWNFVYVDKSYRDDFELAKLCMEQVGNLNTIYEYMSARLRGNKELAMLDLQEDFPNTEYYSSKLRNDDEIAATLFRLHGADSWAWHHMSKRLKKKYKIEEM